MKTRRRQSLDAEAVTLDAVGQTLFTRIRALLAERPDLDRATLGASLGKHPSWLSEFLSGKLSTNDLRLVVQIAALLHVPVSYLLADELTAPDAKTMTLMGCWDRMKEADRDRAVLLQLAVALSSDRGPAPRSPRPMPVASEADEDSVAPTSPTETQPHHQS